MRQYNTAITLALFLGGLVVDARSLPERRSEINVRYSMRDTTLGKRDDIQGNSCLTLCDNKPGDQPDPSDCEWLYMNIQSNSGSFDLAPSEAKVHTHGSCAVVMSNNSPRTITYDWWDFGSMADWLIDDCLHRRMTIFGACVFGNQLDQSPYIGVAHPSHFGL